MSEGLGRRLVLLCTHCQTVQVKCNCTDLAPLLLVVWSGIGGGGGGGAILVALCTVGHGEMGVGVGCGKLLIGCSYDIALALFPGFHPAVRRFSFCK